MTQNNLVPFLVALLIIGFAAYAIKEGWIPLQAQAIAGSGSTVMGISSVQFIDGTATTISRSALLVQLVVNGGGQSIETASWSGSQLKAGDQIPANALTITLSKANQTVVYSTQPSTTRDGNKYAITNPTVIMPSDITSMVLCGFSGQSKAGSTCYIGETVAGIPSMTVKECRDRYQTACQAQGGIPVFCDSSFGGSLVKGAKCLKLTTIGTGVVRELSERTTNWAVNMTLSSETTKTITLTNLQPNYKDDDVDVRFAGNLITDLPTIADAYLLYYAPPEGAATVKVVSSGQYVPPTNTIQTDFYAAKWGTETTANAAVQKQNNAVNNALNANTATGFAGMVYKSGKITLNKDTLPMYNQVFALYLDKNWVGIRQMTAKPNIVSVSAPSFTTQGNVGVLIKNNGDYGSVRVYADCNEPSITISQQQTDFAAQEQKIVYLTAYSNVAQNKVCMVCAEGAVPSEKDCEAFTISVKEEGTTPIPTVCADGTIVGKCSTTNKGFVCNSNGVLVADTTCETGTPSTGGIPDEWLIIGVILIVGAVLVVAVIKK